MSNLRIDNIAPSAGGTYRNAPRGIAAAWLHFDGTGTPTILGSENVGSITDNGTGDYTCNFSSSMSNSTYGGGSSAASSQANGQNCQMHIYNVGSLRLRAENSSGTLTDCARLVFTINGDLA